MNRKHGVHRISGNCRAAVIAQASDHRPCDRDHRDDGDDRTVMMQQSRVRSALEARRSRQRRRAPLTDRSQPEPSPIGYYLLPANRRSRRASER